MSSKAQTTLTVYSYGGEIPVKRILNVAEGIGIKGREVNAPEELRGTIGIGHFETTDQWQQAGVAATGGEVRVRVSSAGIPDASPPRLTDDGVYLLELVVRPNSIDDTLWKQLLKSISDQKELRRLAGGKADRSVYSLFFHEAAEMLPALAILCQGYIVAHAGKTNRTPRRRRDGDQDVERALKQMGWPSLADTHEGARVAAVAAQHASETELPGAWWRSVVGGDQGVLKARVLAEIRSLGRSRIPKDLSALLSAVYCERPLRDCGIAARAYRSIADLLGGGPR